VDEDHLEQGGEVRAGVGGMNRADRRMQKGKLKKFLRAATDSDGRFRVTWISTNPKSVALYERWLEQERRRHE